MILVLLKWRKDALSRRVKQDNYCSEQSLKQSTIPFFGGPPTNENVMAKPENDSP